MELQIPPRERRGVTQTAAAEQLRTSRPNNLAASQLL